MKLYIKILLIVSVVNLFGEEMHPLKMSTTKLYTQNHKLYFQIKLFADDLSAGMSQVVKKAINYEEGELSLYHKSVLQSYVSNNLIFSSPQKKYILQFEKVYADHTNPDMTVVWVEGYVDSNTNIEKIDNILIANTLLFQYCPEQKNLVNVVEVNGLTTTLIFNNDEQNKIEELKFK